MQNATQYHGEGVIKKREKSCGMGCSLIWRNQLFELTEKCFAEVSELEKQTNI